MAGDTVRFRLAPPSGPEERGEGRLALAEAELTITAPAGLPLRVPFHELGEVDQGDCVLVLHLVRGGLLELSHLGRRFDEVARTLAALRRRHLDAALFLAEEGAAEEDRGAVRVRAPDGTLGGERTAALRPQRTSLAVLCDGERPWSLPYGEVRSVTFDAEAYAVVLGGWDGGAVELLKLGKRTDAVRRALEERMAGLAERSARALAALAPHLSALEVRALAAVLRDGVAASRGAIEAAAPGAWEAIWKRSFASGRRPHAEALAARARGRWLCVKELATSGGDAPGEPAEPAAEPQAGGEGPGATLPPECEGRRLLHLFEIDRCLVVEAPGSEAVATYVFRAGADPGARAAALCRAFAAVQFRREPFHLPDDALLSGANARYRELVALVPELRQAREAFLGRAIHASLEAWRGGLEQALARG
jgi:hypothetical protein